MSESSGSDEPRLVWSPLAIPGLALVALGFWRRRPNAVLLGGVLLGLALRIVRGDVADAS